MPSEKRIDALPGDGTGGESSPNALPRETPPSLLVLGASARAWASSVARTGLVVHAADLFADRDLLAIATGVTIPPERYPGALSEAAAGFPWGPWCYTGALENHPGLVDSIAAARPLAGNAGDVIRRVRSPRLLAAELADAGIDFPPTHDGPDGLPIDGRWLRKPRASGGGQGIAPWTGPETAARAPRGQQGFIWQEHCPGLPVAGVFIVTSRGARLVGASRQLIGVKSWHASPFAYCGSVDVDPLTLPAGLGDQWDRIGALLAGSFGLRGAVGVDAIVTPPGRLVVIEINPRPTASMELVDRRTGGALAADHLAAYGIVTGPPHPVPAGGRWAKAILRTATTIAVDERLCDRLDGFNAAWSGADGWPAIADLPRCGSVMPPGAPCLTLFAVADTGRRARRLLDERMEIVGDDLARP